MPWYRNYWVYSAGLAIAWAVVLLLVLTVGGTAKVQITLLLFLAFVLSGCPRPLHAMSIRHQSAGRSMSSIGKP